MFRVGQIPGVAMRRQEPAAARRTQVERSADTRERLLDATIESLVEVGYARTTTTVVCERAGLSRGAQVHHFPRKEELVLEAVAHLAARSEAALLEQARDLPGGGKRVPVLVERMVELFTRPDFYAALELWVASRTDEGLREPLMRFERQVGRRLVEIWRELAGEASSAPDFTAVAELTMLLAQGLALQKILRPEDARTRRLLKQWKSLVVTLLAES